MPRTVSTEHVFWLHLIAEGLLDWKESVIGTDSRSAKPTTLSKVMLFGTTSNKGAEKLIKKIQQARVKVFFYRSEYSPERVTELLEGDFQGLSNPPPEPDDAEIAVAQERVNMVIRHIEAGA